MSEDQGEVQDAGSTDVDNQTTEDNSSQSTSEEPEKLFQDSFGNKYTAEEFQSKFNEVTGSFTSKAEEAKRYKQELEQYKNQAQVDAKAAVDDNDLLKNMPPDVKLAVQKLVEPMFETFSKQQEEASRQKEANKALETELSNLEKKYDGSNGLPKFDKNAITQKMLDPNNRVYDPELLYIKSNEKSYNEYLIKEALKNRGNDTKTENTGSGDRAPQTKQPKTFSDAARSFMARLNS